MAATSHEIVLQDEDWTPPSRANKEDKGGRNNEEKHELQPQDMSKETQNALFNLEHQYLQRHKNITRELAYRKVIDKLSTTLGSNFLLLCQSLQVVLIHHFLSSSQEWSILPCAGISTIWLTSTVVRFFSISSLPIS